MGEKKKIENQKREKDESAIMNNLDMTHDEDEDGRNGEIKKKTMQEKKMTNEIEKEDGELEGKEEGRGRDNQQGRLNTR